MTRPGWCSNKSTIPTCVPVGSLRECSPWVQRRLHSTLHLSYCCSATQQVTDQCLPLQVNRIKIPKQLDELVEMQNESANPVLKVLFKIKAELRGVWCFFFYLLFSFCLSTDFSWLLSFKLDISLPPFFFSPNRSGWLLWDASTTQWKTTLWNWQQSGSLCPLGKTLGWFSAHTHTHNHWRHLLFSSSSTLLHGIIIQYTSIVVKWRYSAVGDT